MIKSTISNHKWYSSIIDWQKADLLTIVIFRISQWPPILMGCKWIISLYDEVHLLRFSFLIFVGKVPQECWSDHQIKCVVNYHPDFVLRWHFSTHNLGVIEQPIASRPKWNALFSAVSISNIVVIRHISSWVYIIPFAQYHCCHQHQWIPIKTVTSMNATSILA